MEIIARRDARLVLVFGLVGILFLALTTLAGAQSPTTTLVGTVLDAQTTAPIANATVSVIGTSTARAVTDSSGNFVASDIPVAAPFLQVTITITATGYGSWTMRDTPLYSGITRTLRVRLSQQEQSFTDSLPRALIGGEQLPIDLRLVPRSPLYFSNSVPPSTIRVGITNGAPGYTTFPSCSGWVNAGEPVVRVDTVDLTEYAENVLPHEWYASWGDNAPDSLRAGAMAVKMFAWWRVNLGGVRPQGADVVDNTCDQEYVPNTNDSRTDAAVDLTKRYIMRRNGVVIEIHFLATVSQCQSSSLQPCMPQWGTYDDALNGMTWIPIVHKYYDPVQIVGYWYFFPMMRR